MLACSLFTSMIFCFVFGWLSDKVGRKPLIMTGLLLGTLTLYPFYVSLTHFGNPDLELAMQNSPAVVIANPNECSFQLVPAELKSHIKFTSSCDILKNLLNQYSVSYANLEGPPGSLAKLIIGNVTVSSVNVTGIMVILVKKCAAPHSLLPPPHFNQGKYHLDPWDSVYSHD